MAQRLRNLAMRDVMLRFCEDVEAGRTPDPRVLRELCDAFRSVLSDWPDASQPYDGRKVRRAFDRALGLRAPRGRPGNRVDDLNKFNI